MHDYLSDSETLIAIALGWISLVGMFTYFYFQIEEMYFSQWVDNTYGVSNDKD